MIKQISTKHIVASVLIIGFSIALYYAKQHVDKKNKDDLS